MRHIIRTLLVLASTTAVSACDNPLAPTPNDPATTTLSRAVALDMLDAFGESFTDDEYISAAAGRARQLADVQLSVSGRDVSASTSYTSRCPLGGTVNLHLAAPVSSGATSALFNMTHVGCGARSGRGRTWMFDGDPTVQTRIDFPNGLDVAVTGGRISYQLTGGFRYASGGDTGRCNVDVRFEYTYTLQNGRTPIENERVVGTICGMDVNDTL
jgi:hypothetical protein